MQRLRWPGERSDGNMLQNIRAAIGAQGVSKRALTKCWHVCGVTKGAPFGYTGGLRSGFFTGEGVALQGD